MSHPDDTTPTPASEEQRSTPNTSDDDGLRDTSLLDTPADGPPEQSAGGEEPQPDGLKPKAGYPRADPRHEDKPYRP